MKRFIPVSLALLFGLISTQEVFMPEPVFLATSSMQEKVEAANEKLQRLNCFLYDDLTFFDLRKLESETGYELVGTNSKLGYFQTYEVNFCKRFAIEREGKTLNTFAYTHEGKSLSSSRVLLTDDGAPSYTETVLKSNDEEQPHILFQQDGGDDCKQEDNTKVKYSIEYEVFCNPSVTGVPELKIDDSTNFCRPRVTLTHAAGCPVFQATSIIRWLASHPIIMGIILLAFGAVVTLFGGKFFPYVLATVTGGLTVLIVLLLASVLGALKALDKENKEPTGGQYAAAVFSFIIAIAAGAFVGWFLKKVRRIAITLVGAAAGFFGGFLLYTFVFAKWTDQVAVLIVISALCAIVGGYICWRFDKHLIIYLTAFLGAYAFIRGISVFAGKFPNEMVLYGQLSSGAYDGLNNEFYAYFFGIIVTGVIGAIFQFKMGYHLHHQSDEEYQKV